MAGGYRNVKLKFCPGWDMPVVTAVRAEFPDLAIHVDCNSAYTLADAPMLRQLDRLRLTMIEQPLAHDDLLDHAALQKQIVTPICLDESISSVHRARQAVEIGACRFINVKHGRVGGVTPARQIHDLCRTAGMGCWIGGMLESSLGLSFSVALATLPGVTYPSDIESSDKYYKLDLARPEVRLCGPARILPSVANGAGAEPDPAQLEAMCAEQATVR